MSEKKFKLIKKKTVESSVKDRNSWTFTIATLGITGTICYLLITGKVNIDSSTLLSLILAFFSIYLSATFYFKSTEQSNHFYNTAFNHNKNISESLSGMKGEFGTSLRMIEESSNYMKNRFNELNNLSGNINTSTKLQEELRSEFAELIDKSGIEEEEKKRYSELLEQQSELLNKINTNFEKVKKTNDFVGNSSVAATITVRNNGEMELNSYYTNLLIHFLEPFYSRYSYQLKSSFITKDELNRMFLEFQKLMGDPLSIIKENLKSSNYIDLSGNLTDKGYHHILNFVKSK
ncbi:hypothetical protein H9650_11440 [Psychrobacillus sp. Sa2BUA9]|uniref:Uncharacterized protein n=1 Tax=Psychrobacillus faecigallinarum TaxID=2762235 RepID=A0ABR8RAH6_9BACI|nr:hypothetical protein [Psychrobacillus faecigallinarum]MBD7944729.1 hypothetical protein [Psychrobacillus faecigallinarum]